MSWEFIKCSFANKCFATYYLTSLLYRIDVRNVLDYVPPKMGRKIQDLINDRRLGDFLSNKFIFVEHFKRGGFPVPQLLAYNTLDKMQIQSSDGWITVELSSSQVLKNTLCSLVQSNGLDAIFLKPIRGTQGKGAFKIFPFKLIDEKEFNSLFSLIIGNHYIFQQVVSQHPTMSQLNPTSLNTMRIDTFRASGEPAEILSAFLRIGGENNNVDNVSSGGFFIGIDLDSGCLKDKAMNRFHGSDILKSFENNPSNGIPFSSFQIPYFDEVKQTILRAADWIPSAFLGWDVAVGVDGPVLIEANILYYGFTGSDIAYGGYRKNPVFQRASEYARRPRH